MLRQTNLSRVSVPNPARLTRRPRRARAPRLLLQPRPEIQLPPPSLPHRPPPLMEKRRSVSWTLPLPRRNAGKILISSERSVRRQSLPVTRAAPQPNRNGSRLKETPTGTLKWHPAARTWWSQTSPPTSLPSPSRSSHPTRRPLLARKSPAARPPALLRTARLHPSHRIRPSKTCCGRGSEVTLAAWPHQPTSSPPLFQHILHPNKDGRRLTASSAVRKRSP